MEIQKFIKEYWMGTVDVTDDISYDTRTVIETNRRIWHSIFEEPKDKTGLEKIYYNVGFILWNNLYNDTDIDTKDLKMSSTNGVGLQLLSVLSNGIRWYLKRTTFDSFLNQVRQVQLRDGSALVKLVNGQLKIVDWLNVVRPGHQPDIQKVSLAERIPDVTYEELEAEKDRYESGAWEKIERLWDKMQEEGISEFVKYEYWTWEKFNGKVQKVCKMYLDAGIIEQEEVNNPEDWEPFIHLETFASPTYRKVRIAAEQKLYGKKQQIFPYWKVDMITVEGRGLGFGIMELTKGIGKHINEQLHLWRKRNLLDLRGVFVHKKASNTTESLTQDFLNNLETGATVELEQGEELERLAISRMTNEVLSSTDTLFNWARQITGMSARGVGDSIPATMPATNAMIEQQKQQGTNDAVIEQLSIFLVHLFEDTYCDIILENMTEEQWIGIVGNPSDLQELDRFFVTQLVIKKAQLFKNKYGFYPTPTEFDREVKRLMENLETQGDMRFADLTKKLVAKIDYYIEFSVNSERFDRNVQIKWLENRLADPNSTLSKKKIEEKIMELGTDFNVREFRKTEEEIQEELQRAAAQAGQQLPPMQPSQQINRLSEISLPNMRSNQPMQPPIQSMQQSPMQQPQMQNPLVPDELMVSQMARAGNINPFNG